LLEEENAKKLEFKKQQANFYAQKNSITKSDRASTLIESQNEELF